MKFKKKPIEVEATQWKKHGDHKEVREFNTKFYAHTNDEICKECEKPFSQHGMCKTLEGNHIVCPNDWIITGIKGETYPCKPDIFEQTYDLIKNGINCKVVGCKDENEENPIMCRNCPDNDKKFPSKCLSFRVDNNRKVILRQRNEAK